MKKRILLTVVTLVIVVVGIAHFQSAPNSILNLHLSKLWKSAVERVLPDKDNTTAYAATRPILYWGTQGNSVRLVQSRLKQWGYYDGEIDGIFGTQTSQAVKKFQAKNGLTPDGLVGPKTWEYLGFSVTTTAQPAITQVKAQTSRGVSSSNDVNLLARLVAAEAEGEPYVGQVAVAAVILNRVKSPEFPNTLAGVIYQPGAFESITNGLAWSRTPSATAVKAARDAMNGWDPTYGCVFFWNPAKPITNKWIWSRPIVTRIGSHVFAK